jgi:hypothetical protein
MRKLIFSIISIVISVECYSQISFENGYFVNEANKRIECLIKNIDWKDNPTDFKYKETPGRRSKKNRFEACAGISDL